MYDIIIRYRDGREARHGERPGTIDDALSVALDVADDLGHAVVTDDPRRARSVEIWEGEDMQLSIAVFINGLLSGDVAPAGR
jgi:hypothetical protein